PRQGERSEQRGPHPSRRRRYLPRYAQTVEDARRRNVGDGVAAEQIGQVLVGTAPRQLSQECLEGNVVEGRVRSDEQVRFAGQLFGRGGEKLAVELESRFQVILPGQEALPVERHPQPPHLSGKLLGGRQIVG